MDHGMLNVPLRKRGDIDAQIDDYKAGQAAEAASKRKRDAADLKVKRDQARAAVESLADDRAQALMEKFGLSRKQLTKKLSGIAYWQPDVILRGI